MKLKVKQIIKATGGQLIRGEESVEFRGVSMDSRTITETDIFFALGGEYYNRVITDARADGHDFLGEVAKKQIKGVVVSKQVELNFPVMIKVEDTLKAYEKLAQYWRDQFSLPIVAITGSVGKTTTKNMITSVLSQRFNVLAAQKGFNNRVGVSATLLELRAEHEVAVLEVGTNIPGEIKLLSGLIRPMVAVITNIAPAHLEQFKTLKAIAREKSTILSGTKIAILNKDNQYFDYLKGKAPGKVLSFHEPDAMDQNRAAARRVGRVFGLREKAIAEGLATYQPGKMRLEQLTKNGISFINDAYNANPVSTYYALSILDQAETSGRKIAVLGDMRELGTWSQKYHQQIGRSMPDSIDILLTVGEEAKIIAESVARVDQVYQCSSPKEAKEKLWQVAKPGDLVLLKASRGVALEKLLD